MLCKIRIVTRCDQGAMSGYNTCSHGTSLYLVLAFPLKLNEGTRVHDSPLPRAAEEYNAALPRPVDRPAEHF